MSIGLTLRNFFNIDASNEAMMMKYAETGDEKIFEALYDACADDLYHFLLTQSDTTLAKDICQKAWLKVIEKRHLYRDTGKFKTWLFTLARNQLIDDLRKTGRWNETPMEDISLSSKDDYSHSIDKAFDQALKNLPFEQREAFCLQQEGFGLQEIADMTQCPTETIKSRVRYARNSLRKNLENFNEQ